MNFSNSALTQRIAAWSLAIILAFVGVQIVLALSGWASRHVEELQAARVQRDRLEQIVASPVAKPQPNGSVFWIVAKDVADARATLDRQIQAAGALSGLSEIPLGEAPNSARATISRTLQVSGSPEQLVALLQNLERSMPSARITRWRLSLSTEPSKSQVEATIASPWVQSR